jgi:serine/threonine-protein kinase
MIAGDPLIGRQLANYRIERVIGRGGMAQVYYGRDVVLHRPVAVKIIDARYRGSPAYAKRFVQEAQTVALWRHENIVSIYYAGQEGELYYFAMEHIDGVDLGVRMSQYTTAGKLMPHAEAVRVGRAIASALDYAHRKGVIHRDVKPSNVILANDGRVVLTDFGLALHVQQGSLGEVFGTARYTAPEQARRSADAVPQSDLYSLGVILYEMLAGSLPFDDPSPTSVALQHMTLPPPRPRAINPDLNDAAEAVLLKALSKSPGDRYPTGGELMNALESALLTRRPAGSQLPAARTLREPQRSLAERVASYLQADIAPPDAVQPAWPPAGDDSVRRRSPGAFLATRGRLLILAAIAVVAGAMIVINRQSTASQPPASAPARATTGISPTTTAIPATTPTAPGQVIAPAETALPIAPGADASTPTLAPTPTFVPPTPALSGVEGATEPPPATPLPTVLYPGGRHFLVYYDDNGLYLHNASGRAGAVSPLAFERLDASGTPLNRFDGWRWSRYYPRIEIASCMRVEIRSSPSYLRPSPCNNRYNSTVTASRNDDFVFWTTQTGASQFRVLWNAEEVARCEIATGVCEVFLP